MPTNAATFVDPRSLARNHTPSAIKRIIGLAKNAKSEDVRLKANLAIVERGWGKPIQPIEAKIDGPPVSIGRVYVVQEQPKTIEATKVNGGRLTYTSEVKGEAD